MNNRYTAALLVLLLILVSAFVTLSNKNKEKEPTPQKAVISETGAANVIQSKDIKPSPSSVTSIQAQENRTVGIWLSESFDSLSGKLSKMTNLGQRSKLLNELKQALLSHPDSRAIRDALIKWIHTKVDFETGLKFRPGKEGTLKSWNSGRIFALDILSQIDLEAASDQSWKLLNESTNRVSETIFALKCVAQYDGKQITQNKDWMSKVQNVFMEHLEAGAVDPSILYGLDLLVYSEDANQMELLNHLQNGPKALQHGSQIAAKRLVINQPTDCFESILNNDNLWKENPSFKGSLFGYADPSDAHQAGQIEEFMGNPNNAPESVQIFLRSFPNFDRGVSYNLLTKTTAASMNQARKADKAALELVEKWIKEQRYPTYQKEIDQAHQRLNRYVQSAQAGQ